MKEYLGMFTVVVMILCIKFELVSDFLKGAFAVLIVESVVFLLYLLYRKGGPLRPRDKKELPLR